MAEHFYKISSIHVSNNNILVYIFPANVLNFSTTLIDLSDDSFLLLDEEYEPFFHVLPLISKGSFISFINPNVFDDPESIVACGFINKSFFLKGGFNYGS